MDPLGRKHQIDRKPKNRWRVDDLCDYVMKLKEKSFQKDPSSSHIYYSAYAILYGEESAAKMLTGVRR